MELPDLKPGPAGIEPTSAECRVPHRSRLNRAVTQNQLQISLLALYDLLFKYLAATDLVNLGR